MLGVIKTGCEIVDCVVRHVTLADSGSWSCQSGVITKWIESTCYEWVDSSSTPGLKRETFLECLLDYHQASYARCASLSTVRLMSTLLNSFRKNLCPPTTLMFKFKATFCVTTLEGHPAHGYQTPFHANHERPAEKDALSHKKKKKKKKRQITPLLVVEADTSEKESDPPRLICMQSYIDHAVLC
ncbi:hypothetical protein BR93DRAFT_160781 [Coniochaeta sp. PMI_546]|nr:hypothetical protein BR93DRAFT_160781 [Coniochaeta sp. PMI_546]